MRRIRLDVAYDGTDFCGWQIQPGQRTVQGLLTDTLARLQGKRPLTLHGAGRTDSGVHAASQTAHCEIDTRLDDVGLEHALGGMLPVDLRVQRLRSVHGSFHARHDARAKIYRYTLDRSRWGDPLRARYALRAPGELDRAAIERALVRLPGRRDWSGFAAAGCVVVDRVRTLWQARLVCEGDAVWQLIFCGDGFLRYMVRNLVGTLLAIGRGRMAEPLLGRILDSGDRELAAPTAPPHGLTLERVLYDEDASGPWWPRGIDSRGADAQRASGGE